MRYCKKCTMPDTRPGITFDAEALKGYSTHPAHVAVANGKVRPYTAVRTCLDFTV